MKKSCLIFLGSVLSLSGIPSSNAALNCTASPDCASLGYTMTAADCTDKVKVACPTDTSKVFCKKDVIQSVTCAVGSILGGDQLCYKDKLPEGVKPVGIVFDTTNKLAVALTDINSSGSAGSSTMIWSANYYDIPALDNCTSDTDLTTCGVDGRANTTAILNCGSSCGSTPAATATNSYEPSGCSKDFCKKTNWFLPSMRDLITLYNAKSYVNASLSLTASSGAKTLTENWYWSSTEYNSNGAWRLHMNGGGRSSYGKNLYYYVRPVIYYGTCQIANCKTCEPGRTDSCQICNTGYNRAENMYKKAYCLKQINCSVLNCQTCVSGDSSTCKICKSGYTLQSGKCVSAGFVCELPRVQRTCNGMKCCCPQGVYCDSNYKCLCDSTSMGQGIVQ